MQIKKCNLIFLISAILVLLTSNIVSALDNYSSDSKKAFVEPTFLPIGNKVNATRFIGDVYLRELITSNSQSNFLPTNLITFEPGARSKWHQHEEMIVIGISGEGFYQEEGKSAVILKRGDIVQIKAGTKHRHGAIKNSKFTQIVIFNKKCTDKKTNKIIHVDLDKNINLNEIVSSNKNKEFLFDRGDKIKDLDKFSGNVYLSNPLPKNNVLSLNNFHHVVIDKGVISNWHSHDDEFVIATDGVGYLQIEGQEIKVLMPGDVVFCPKGVKHWIGATKDNNFAYITISHNSNNLKTKWFNRLSLDQISKLPTVNSIVRTTYGKVKGVENDGIIHFYGIPYAKADKRFERAQKLDYFDGVFNANNFGKISYQGIIPGLDRAQDQTNSSNNAQNLNIWTPSVTDNNKRAVMVWLHGGGFSIGSANLPQYDGDVLSKKGNVVVVGVNHRLNVFGHMDLSAYGEKYKDSANVGMTDIVDALKYIHQNIDKFGGDPNNITLFGQSGGGAKVLALMASEEALGLFQKAIVQSGTTETMGAKFNTKEQSLALTENIIDMLGIDREHIDDLQNVPYQKLIEISSKALKKTGEDLKIPSALGSTYSMDYEPVVDGNFLKTDPVTKDGFSEYASNIDLLIGSNLNEWTQTFPNDYKDISNNIVDEVKKAYPYKKDLNVNQIDTSLIRLPTLKITIHKAMQNKGNVYSYVFTYGNSHHSAEIPYVFNHANKDAEQIKLANTISDAWINFAKFGVPASKNLPKWTPFTLDGGDTMILDSTSHLMHHHDRKLLELLEPNYKF